MKYQEFLPSAHLAKDICSYWTLEKEDFSKTLAREPGLPDNFSAIALDSGSTCRRFYFDKVEIQPQSMVIGQMKEFVLSQSANSLKIFGVRFQPLRVHILFKQPIEDFAAKIERGDTFLVDLGKDFEQEIDETLSSQQQISAFEKVYEKYFYQNKNLSDLLESAIQTIFDHDGRMQVEQIARNLNTNFKQLERQFKNVIGITPKSFSRIVRLQKIIRCLNQTAVSNWADLACSFGYFDQAHFIKDFKNFTGTTPEVFIRKENQITDFFIN